MNLGVMKVFSMRPKILASWLCNLIRHSLAGSLAGQLSSNQLLSDHSEDVQRLQ